MSDSGPAEDPRDKIAREAQELEAKRRAQVAKSDEEAKEKTKKAREAKEIEVAEKAEQNRLKQEKAAQLAREEQLKHEQELARKAQEDEEKQKLAEKRAEEQKKKVLDKEAEKKIQREKKEREVQEAKKKKAELEEIEKQRKIAEREKARQERLAAASSGAPAAPAAAAPAKTSKTPEPAPAQENKSLSRNASSKSFSGKQWMPPSGTRPYSVFSNYEPEPTGTAVAGSSEQKGKVITPKVVKEQPLQPPMFISTTWQHDPTPSVALLQLKIHPPIRPTPSSKPVKFQPAHERAPFALGGTFASE